MFRFDGDLAYVPEKFRAKDYEVRSIPHFQGKAFIERWHYSRGCSNTAVYCHGLYLKNPTGGGGGGLTLLGVAMWLPPTRVAAESVNREDWKRVLSLTRLAVHHVVPTNGASFLMGASMRIIEKEARFCSLVTYADESQGHTGAIYRATNWDYIGRTGPYPRWLDQSGKQVAPKATTNRTKAQMEALGHVKSGAFFKHKFVRHLSAPKPTP